MHSYPGRQRGVTYQLQLVRCGKRGCDKLHGPYWYAFWKRENRTHTFYVGSDFRSITAREILATEQQRAAAAAKAARSKTR